MRRTRRPDPTSEDGWTGEVSSGFALAGFLFLVFLGFTLLAMGPLMSLDAYFNLAPPPPSWVPFLHILDRIGQRAVCLPILGVVTFLCCRYRESWRPAFVVAFSVFTLNLVVLIFKVLLGRGQPEAADPHFFVGGMAYPSGHTSNIVLVYGLVAYLLGRYRGIGRNALRLMWTVVGVLSLTMVITSLTLNWHWFADLIAGLLIGGLVLQLTAAVDAAVPQSVLAGGPRDLRAWARRVVGHRRRPSVVPPTAVPRTTASSAPGTAAASPPSPSVPVEPPVVPPVLPRQDAS
jgi:membrane-associated phospholipid phosphatase